MPIKLPTITCSTLELAFLAGLLGADSLIGVPDPFAGCSGDVAEAARAEARRSLSERRLIAVHPDGSIGIEEAVAELVGTCGFAEATFMLTYTAADRTVSGHHFHLIRQSAVELVLRHESVLTCQLTGLDTPIVLDRVAELFRLGAQQAPAVPNARLSEANLRTAGQLAESAGVGAAEQHLRGSGLAPETAAGLALSLARPLGNGALVAMANARSDFGVDGLAVLEGENGLWLLKQIHEDGARLVDVVPCSAPDMREFLRSFMNRVLPGKLL